MAHGSGAEYGKQCRRSRYLQCQYLPRIGSNSRQVVISHVEGWVACGHVSQFQPTRLIPYIYTPLRPTHSSAMLPLGSAPVRPCLILVDESGRVLRSMSAL